MQTENPYEELARARQPMDEHYQREERIFDAALALPASQRGAFVAQACGNEATLRGRIEALLREHERAVTTIDVPPALELAAAARQEVALSFADASPGAYIGRHQLLEKIGEGGCGVVFRAEQREPVRRDVALKIVKLGMDTWQVIARFEAELQEALAIERKYLDRDNLATADTLHKLGIFLRDSARLDEAKAAYEESLRIRRADLARDPDNPTFARFVIVSLANLYEFPAAQDRHAEAEVYAREALAIVRRVLPQDKAEHVGGLRRLGRTLAAWERSSEAEAAFREAFAKGLEIADPRIDQAITGLDRILVPAGRTGEAAALWQQVIDRCGQLTVAQEAGVFVTHTVGALNRSGRFAQSEALAREHLLRWEKSRPEDWHAFAFRLLIGSALSRQGRFAEAEPLLISGCDGLRERRERMPPNVLSELAQPMSPVAQFYTPWGRSERAAEWNRKHAESLSAPRP